MKNSLKFIFPKAVQPPKLVKPVGLWLGRGLAVISGGFALTHLARIDTFVPVLDKTIPGSTNWAGLVATLIILAEIFALPFLLRIKLSPMAHIVSGFMAILAPLLWSMIAIWAYGTDVSIGQFSAFLNTPTSWWLIASNIVWLTYSFYTLWSLGYNRLKVPRLFEEV